MFDSKMGTLIASMVLVYLTARYLVLPCLSKRWNKLDADPQPDCSERDDRPVPSKARPSKRPVVKLIELTDLGEFVDRCQLTDVLYELTRVDRPELIVSYIHGWMHDATRDDEDRKKFEHWIRFLDKLSRRMKPRRHVVGVYIGWQGAFGPGPLRFLTFWNRKRAADQICQSGAVTKIIADMENARALNKHSRDDLRIMVGHSFGARMLFNATSHVLLRDVAHAHPLRPTEKYQRISGPADLILLLNPAFEASIFTVLHNLRRVRKETIDENQQPLLLSVATENDGATKWAFPLGQWLGFARAKLQRTTLGNFEKYRTHTLRRSTGESRAKGSEFWFDGFRAGGIELRRKEAHLPQPGNPFLVADTQKDLIDGHSRIWDSDFVKWIIRFVATLDRQRRQTKQNGQKRRDAGSPPTRPPQSKD